MIKITEKGRAILAATECGLVPKTDDGYDDEAFLNFWDSYIKGLYKRILWKNTIVSLTSVIFAVIALLTR